MRREADPGQEGWVARPLAGRVLDPGHERSFVLAEWTDDESRAGELIELLGDQV